MTALATITIPSVSDAFSTKYAEENILLNTCFSARYKNDSGFTSTGKEKDPETGYSYFGARYLDHELMTAWLSVDPMADKYPSISPYAYCAWNPLKLVDPNGDTIRIQDDNGQFRYVELSQISSFRNSKDPREKALFFMSNDTEGYEF